MDIGISSNTDTTGDLGETEALQKPPPLPAWLLLDRVFITTPPAQMALQAINDLLEFGHRGDYCEGLMILGPSRVGKSAMLRHFVTGFPQTMMGRQVIRPVVYVKLREADKPWSLTSALLREVGDPRPDHGSPADRSARLRFLLEQQGVRLVIFDEFQHLIDSDTDKIAYRSAETFKTLLEDNVCPYVVCGVSHAERVLNADTQLQNRVHLKVKMYPADWRLERDRTDFRVFLNALEDAVQLPTHSGLGELETAHRIHHFSRGLYGNASNLVREALLIRYRNGDITPCITREQCAVAADHLLTREPEGRLNPFRIDPPAEYAPAPMYENLKEPKPRRARREADDVDF